MFSRGKMGLSWGQADQRAEGRLQVEVWGWVEYLRCYSCIKTLLAQKCTGCGLSVPLRQLLLQVRRRHWLFPHQKHR